MAEGLPANPLVIFQYLLKDARFALKVNNNNLHTHLLTIKIHWPKV